MGTLKTIQSRYTLIFVAFIVVIVLLTEEGIRHFITPHDPVAASTARILNAAGPPYWREAWRMSGVLTKKFGRIR